MWSRIKENLFLKILSLVIAVFVWFIVTVNNNPIEMKSITIPVSIVNEKNLNLRGFKVVDNPDTFLDIQIKGSSSEIDNVKAQDFSALIDYMEIISEDTNTIKVKSLDYSGKANITFSYDEKDLIKDIAVEKVVSSEFPVVLNFSGQLPEGYVLVAYTVTPSIQSISDITSIVSNIGSIEVEVDLDDTYQPFTIRKACKVYDKNGNIINEYSNAVTVDVSVIVGKQIKLASKLSGTSKLGEDHVYLGNTLHYTDAILVGDISVIDEIDTIYTETLDISGKTESFSTEVSLLTPASTNIYTMSNDINLSNKIKINVNIEELSTKRFDYDISELETRNKSLLKEYGINQNDFYIVIKGRGSVLNLLTKKDLLPYVDLLGLSDGQRSLAIRLSPLAANVTLVEASTVNIYVETIASFSINRDRVVLANTSYSYNYDIDNDIIVMRLVGLNKDLEGVDVSELKIFVDVADLAEGVHLIDALVKDENLPDNVRLYEEIKIPILVSNK